MRRPKRLGLGVLAATVAVLPAIWSVGHAANLETRNIDLHQAKVSVVSGSRVVVSMEASGDLRGLLTLTIDRDNNGHLSGEWALVVRYVQDVDASGNPIKPDFDESQGEPQERIQLIDKGTLSGAITDGALDVDPNGVVTGVNALQLGLTSGSLTFDGASGSGSATATSVQDTQASSGALTLTF